MFPYITTEKTIEFTERHGSQVDNLVERLNRQVPKTRVLRLGHPARLLPEVPT